MGCRGWTIRVEWTMGSTMSNCDIVPSSVGFVVFPETVARIWQVLDEAIEAELITWLMRL